MKKIFAIMMTICLLASLLCVSAFAAEPADELPEPAEGTVLRVTATKGNDTVLIGDYTNFEDGWNDAMELAGSTRQMRNNGYDRVVVDIYTNWTAAADGNFTDDGWLEKNGPGFDNDTIFVPADAKVTLNLNGYTINRGLTDDINDGEVMFINDDADIIINDGTITGGFSNSEGAGLYIEGAKVTLNNVHITGNTVEDDDGAGIAAYGGATLIINGGSISDNIVSKDSVEDFYGGAIYIENGTATLTGVTIQGNAYDDPNMCWLYGAVIYSVNSSIKMSNCTVQENGLAEYNGVAYGDVNSIIYAEDSEVVLENTDFIDNGHKSVKSFGSGRYRSNPIANSFFSVKDSDFTLTGGTFTGNDMAFLIKLVDSTAYVEGVDFTDNDALALVTANDSSTPSVFIDCKFGAGTSISDYYKYDFDFWDDESGVTFEDCTFNKSTFSDKSAATFIGGNVSNSVGSIFGEGSFTMIVSLAALAVSAACLGTTMSLKKKLEPAKPADEE